MIKKVSKLCIILLMLFQSLLWAGYPFLSDDPDAVGYRQSEIFVGSIGVIDAKSFNASLPQLCLAYGAFKDTEFHAILPFVLDKNIGYPANYGLGMIELGVKYRIVHETATMPQIAISPIIELATADASKGLGNINRQTFLPIWIQKSWGQEGQAWTAYGGGGYWFNPGFRNQDHWFFGCVIQRDISKSS